MKQRLKTLVPFLAVLAVDFYLLPFLIVDTGSAMLFLLIIIPLIAFIDSFLFGFLKGFDILLTVFSMILFLPTVFIHYNESALIYTVVYGIIVLIGNGFGFIFSKRKRV